MNRSVTMMQMALLLLGTGLGGWVWTQLPPGAMVPVHWGRDLQVDGWADKSFGLSIIPVIASVLVGMSAFAAMLAPPSSVFRSRAYGICTTSVLAFLLFLHGIVLLTALGREPSMARVFPVGLGALFVVLGNWMPKIRRNPVFGIRTPWTVRDDRVWDRTHRVGGRLFVGFGAAQIVTAVINPEASAHVMSFGGLGIVGWSLVYSYAIRSRGDSGPQ